MSETNKQNNSDNEYSIKKCCLCRKKLDNKWGNNANPLKNGRCCDNCNTSKVLPARFLLMQLMK